MQKIRLKIESTTPSPVETPPIETPVVEAEQAASPPFPLFSKAKWEAVASEPTSKAGSDPVVQSQAAGCCDTLMRFAAVELEGTLKKEQSHG